MFVVLLLGGVFAYVFRQQVNNIRYFEKYNQNTFCFFIFLRFVLYSIIFLFLFQIANNMKPEMMATIREYDPSNTSDPITKAWDSTQNKVCFKAVKGIGTI